MRTWQIAVSWHTLSCAQPNSPTAPNSRAAQRQCHHQARVAGGAGPPLPLGAHPATRAHLSVHRARGQPPRVRAGHGVAGPGAGGHQPRAALHRAAKHAARGMGRAQTSAHAGARAACGWGWEDCRATCAHCPFPPTRAPCPPLCCCWTARRACTWTCVRAGTLTSARCWCWRVWAARAPTSAPAPASRCGAGRTSAATTSPSSRRTAGRR